MAPTSAGAVSCVLEQVYGLRFTPIRTATLPEADLSRYNVLVLPDATGSPGYAEYLGEGGLAALRSWVEAGGTLVTIKGATTFAARQETGLASNPAPLAGGDGSGEGSPGPGRHPPGRRRARPLARVRIREGGRGHG